MKKVNFDTFQNLTVSDELIGKALSIPKNANQRTPGLMISRIRGFTTAASFMLVLALSIFLILFFENKSTIPIAPSSVQNPPYSTASESTTASQAENTEHTAPENSASTQSATQPATQVATELSTDAEGNVTITVITRITTIEQEPADTPSQARNKAK